MVDVLKTWMGYGHHLRMILRRPMVIGCRCRIFLLIIVIVALAIEVFGTFVFVGSANLRASQVRSPMRPKARGKGATNILVPVKSFLHITGRELIELLVVAKNDNRDIHRTQHRELVSLLEETTLSLEKSPK